MNVTTPNPTLDQNASWYRSFKNNPASNGMAITTERYCAKNHIMSKILANAKAIMIAIMPEIIVVNCNNLIFVFH